MPATLRQESQGEEGAGAVAPAWVNAYRDAIVGYLTRRTAALISQMLASRHGRWPFIWIVTSMASAAAGLLGAWRYIRARRSVYTLRIQEFNRGLRGGASSNMEM